MRTAFSRLALLTCILVVATAAGSRDAFAGDGRTLWLKDLYRHDSIRLRPFGRLGRVTPIARLQVSRFFRSRDGYRYPVHPALLRVLAHLQEHFQGRRLELMSGYRVPADSGTPTSYHQVGRSADLWIEGVELRDVFEYCRVLQARGARLGCGLYPQGSHVHVDVRSQATIWVDLGHYGEGSLYVADPEPWLAQHPAAGRTTTAP
jgi:uncharacterized protein YcbK (DUF882 family)